MKVLAASRHKAASLRRPLLGGRSAAQGLAPSFEQLRVPLQGWGCLPQGIGVLPQSLGHKGAVGPQGGRGVTQGQAVVADGGKCHVPGRAQGARPEHARVGRRELREQGRVRRRLPGQEVQDGAPVLPDGFKHRLGIKSHCKLHGLPSLLNSLQGDVLVDLAAIRVAQSRGHVTEREATAPDGFERQVAVLPELIGCEAQRLTVLPHCVQHNLISAAEVLGSETQGLPILAHSLRDDVNIPAELRVCVLQCRSSHRHRLQHEGPVRAEPAGSNSQRCSIHPKRLEGHLGVRAQLR
mmetsp:Transcript_9173/g.28266  ORF Transcript_9173/g.28266 Transcript_9173/m.28266 type:complete len:295 (+) Transcript_9173:147-1031(+)